MTIRAVRFFTLLSLLIANVTSAAAADSLTYRPNFHATVRPRMEVNTETGDFRFQLRNLRVSADGRISSAIDYFLQADLCDRGSMKFLDGWVRLAVADGLRFQAGQFRMPFGVDPFMAPHNYIFSNRSFVGKQICNYRAVGAKASYSLPSAPLTLEAGVFNPSTIADHTPWNRSAAFASKAQYRLRNTTLTAGYASLSPDSVRMNMIDGCISWKSGRWHAEAEYMFTRYAHHRFKDNHAYNAFVNYAMPIRAGIFNRLSFQGRFDGITAHSNGHRSSDGRILIENNPARNRVTVGSTISYIRTSSMYLDIRADFEKYLPRHGADLGREQSDKLVLEMVLRF